MAQSIIRKISRRSSQLFNEMRMTEGIKIAPVIANGNAAGKNNISSASSEKAATTSGSNLTNGATKLPSCRFETAVFLVVMCKRFRRKRASARRMSSVISGRTLNISDSEIRNVDMSWTKLSAKRQTALCEFSCRFLVKIESPALTRFGLVDYLPNKLIDQNMMAQSNQSTTSNNEQPTSAQLISKIDLSAMKRVDFEEILVKLPSFARHVTAMVGAMDRMINLLKHNQFNELVSYVRSLGLAHSHQRRTAFTAHEWLPFRELFLQVVCSPLDSHNHAQSPQIRLAWTKFLMFIIGEMKHSYCEAIRSELSSQTSSSMGPNSSIDNEEDEETEVYL